MKPSSLRLLTLAIAGAILLCAVGVLLGPPAPSAAGPALTPTLPPSNRILLPLVRFDPTPTPVATPTQTPYSAAAVVYITPNTAINASTFNRSAIIVANQSLGGERLTELRIDLSTAIFPDMVFDPTGAAGDTVFKDVQMNFKSDGLSYTRVFEKPHDGGYDALVLRFGGFDGGDRFEFSVDVDPTSITGVSAPGPAESGSVGGLELVGATLTAVFDNGATYTNQVYRLPNGGAAGPAHSGAWALLRAGVPARPQVSVLGVAAPAVVTAPGQTVRVTGPAGRPAVVLVVEGGLFLGGVPGGGFDVDPFEANSAVTVREYPAVIGPDGFVDVAIDLTRTTPESGVHAIAAVLDDHYGLRGLVAGPVVIELAE
jgi:hypothetical protein